MVSIVFDKQNAVCFDLWERLIPTGYNMWCTTGISTRTSSLFLFINDLPNASKHLKFYFFADDTNLYYDSETLDDVIEKVNKGLKHIKRWLDANKLTLNISRTNYIIFNSPASPFPTDTVIKNR